MEATIEIAALKDGCGQDIDKIGNRAGAGHDDTRDGEDCRSGWDLQRVGFGRRSRSLVDLRTSHASLEPNPPRQSFEALEFLQASIDSRNLGGNKCPDAMTTRDDAALFKLGERLSNGRAADSVALAQLGFGGEHAIIACEFSSLDAREDFTNNLPSERNTSTDHDFEESVRR